MYIIKIKGRTKIPDYIQIRDDDFTLLGYFSYKLAGHSGTWKNSAFQAKKLRLKIW
jgi:hypothetical protein